MRKFQENEKMLGTRESRKIIKTYNKVAQTLVAFEYLWHEAWRNSVDTAKAGLNATLLVRDPRTKRIYVNFDPDILQLIREAKCMRRMNIEIPQNSYLVMLQELKFKACRDSLLYMLNEYYRVTGRVLPITQDLLRPHLQDLELKIRPGLLLLLWTSLSIEDYVANVTDALKRFDTLLSNVRTQEHQCCVAEATHAKTIACEGCICTCALPYACR